VLYAQAGGKKFVTVCSADARRQGVAAGMSLAEARGLGMKARRLVFTLHDWAADRQALQKAAVWCQRFSPLVAVEEAEQPDSLLLDVSGCAPLFGGEQALAEKVVLEFRRRGYLTRAAMADTIGTAWAVAHCGTSVSTGPGSSSTPHAASVIVPPGEQARALGPLGVEGLRLPREMRERLHAFDIRQIDRLQALPRALLPCRFGRDVMRRLDQALGNVPELLIYERPAEDVAASWPFDTPTAERRTIEAVLDHLLEQILQQLGSRQLGVQQLHCSLQTTATPVHFQVGLLQASASFRHLAELVHLHFERIRAPGEVSAIAVRAAVIVPLQHHQEQMFDTEDSTDCSRQFQVLIERLSNRLGKQSVVCPQLVPDVQPERAWRCEPWLGRGASPHASRSTPYPQRPLCLKCRPLAIPVVAIVPGGPPLQFQWQNRSFVVNHYRGPERIETGWWRGRDVRRDYYLVETTTGERFWLFRNLEDESWFLHGAFA
jgi:protein ImuB